MRISPVRRAVLGVSALMIVAGCGSSGPSAPTAASAPLPAEAIAITSVVTTSPATTVATTAPTAGAPAVTPDATAPPATEAPEPEPDPEPQLGAIQPVETTAPAPPPLDLTAIDWANRSYLLPCPTLEPLTEVALVDGEHRATMGHKLWDVQYGELGDPRRPVAVLTIACFGANAFPPSVLVYDGSGPEPELLGYAAWNDSWRYDDRYHVWKVADVAIADGVLVLQGRGYGPGSAGCCPNLWVRVVVGVADDGTLYEISHTEEPYSPS